MMVLVAFFFSIVGATVKTVSQDLPNEVIVFFRNVMGLAALAPLLFRSRKNLFSFQHLGGHFIRSASGLTAMYCSFYAVSQLRLADALLLTYTAPLFVPFIAKIWLKEQIPAGIYRVLPFGFLGILLVLKPGMGIFQPAALVALLAGFFAAVALVGVRYLTRLESITRVVFFFGIFSAAVSSIPLANSWVLPQGTIWLFLLLIGALSTLAQLFMTKAYRFGKAAYVGPFIYAAVPFAVFWDWLIWKITPDLISVFGMGCVCLSGIMIIQKEGRRSKPIL